VLGKKDVESLIERVRDSIERYGKSIQEIEKELVLNDADT
jgi:hypothetical protein